MAMELMTKEIRELFKKTGGQDGKGNEAIVIAKFFDPTGSWTWYATEGQPVLDDNGNEVDFRFFGLVDSGTYYPELGYFMLSELETNRGPYGAKIERDMYYTTQKLSEIE